MPRLRDSYGPWKTIVSSDQLILPDQARAAVDNVDDPPLRGEAGAEVFHVQQRLSQVNLHGRLAKAVSPTGRGSD